VAHSCGNIQYYTLFFQNVNTFFEIPLIYFDIFYNYTKSKRKGGKFYCQSEKNMLQYESKYYYGGLLC